MSIQDQFEIENGVLKAYLGSSPEVQIPEGVHAIGDGAFKGMAWLLKVSFPSTLKTIGNEVFKGCRQLHDVSFPDGLLEVGEFAFHRCHKLEELIFPDSMTKVGGYAFLYCDGLKKVVMEGPVRLGKAVFSHNLSLQEIAVNKELDDANFKDEVFEGCVLLRKIILSGEVFEVENLIEAMNSHSAYPQIIKSIAKSVYHSLQIEDGVLYKFNINLKNITLPEGITAIGKSCFYDKKGIVRITLPKSLREIKANAFLNNVNLEEITLQSEELILDEKAFRGCSNLKKVHLSGETYLLEEEQSNDLVSQIRDQVLGDFYVSGNTLIRYLGNEEQVEIPKEVEIIGERCFLGKERLKIVTCPEGLLEIREQAFAGCLTLQSVVLADRLKRIESEAFAECKKLLKCNLPNSLEYIGEYAFRRCFLLKPFEPWPQKAEIHPYAFYRATHFAQLEKELRGEGKNAGLAGVTPGAGKTEPFQWENVKGKEGFIAPYAFTRQEGIRILKLSKVKRIGKYAYAACPDLEEVIIDEPECVIERDAFSSCANLRRVRLNVKEMGKGIFSHCRKLEEVFLSGVSVLPAESFAGCHLLHKFEAKDITHMDARCFDECIHLNFFDFSGIQVIGERAFERCDSLKSVDVRKVTCGYHAFADCASLESVEISQDTVLKSGVFTGCTQIKSITYQVENGEEPKECVDCKKNEGPKGCGEARKYEFANFSDSLNHAGNPYPALVREVIASIWSCFEIEDRRILKGYSQDGTEITIPRDVEEIGQDVFRDHVRIAKIHIPESVKLFGSHAFSQTAWLEEERKKSELVIVNQVLLDGANCVGKVVIPPSVKRIASWCFAGNIEITELEIPSERITMENLSFRNCLNLKKITDWDGKEYVLRDVSDLRKEAYPELVQRIFSECINCFKLDENANLVESTGNITNLSFPEGIKSVGDGVYKDCHLLESIRLSAATEQIGKSAFENSKWLKTVKNAGAVSAIGAQAFSGCQCLESIDLSDNLRELGSRSFEHCSSLKEIYLSNQLEMIPNRAFFRCKSLTKLVIPSSVKAIEAEAFAFCDHLEEVRISEKTQISDQAFAFCDHVKFQRY